MSCTCIYYVAYFWSFFAASGPVIPIADVRGVNASIYSKGERILRCKLAAVYRLIDHKGWSQGIYNHITVCILPPRLLY